MSDDGAFPLILVCTLWRDLVLSTPLLWSYITIDESSSDYQVKLDASLALSGDLPLTVTLVLPLNTLKPFQHYILRASSLHVYLDNIFHAETFFETLLHGDEVMEMMITLFKEADIRYEGPITWYYSQSPVLLSTKRMGDNIFLGQKQVEAEQVDAYFRSSYPIFHTLFSISRIADTTSFFRHLKVMINLQSLRLACDTPMSGYWSEPYTVVLPQLSEIILTDTIQYKSASEVGTRLGELVQWISAPALEQVGIIASLDSTLHLIHSIYNRNRPLALTLNIGPQDERYDQELVCDGLIYLRRMDIELPACSTNDNEVLRWLKHNVFRHITTSTTCNIIIDSGPELPSNAFQELRCPLNVTFSGLYPQKSFQNRAGNNVDTLTFRTSRTTRKKDPIPTCRKLRYDPYDPHKALNIMHHPDSWPTDLEELDSGISSFRIPSLRSLLSTFSRLTTVTCTPEVASVLIKQGLPSILQVLTLVSTGKIVQDEKGYYAMANAFQRRHSEDPIFGSNLAQLNIQYFPPWFNFLKLLNLIVQRRDQALLSVELPGFPHKSILTSLVSVLSRTPPVTDGALYRQRVPEAYRSGYSTLPLNCTNCYNSGFKCYRVHEYGTCKRFINGLKVSITRDTILV